MCFNPEDVPPGWGFHPTDQQLLSYYPNLKDLLTHPNPDFDIKVITLSEYDPWDLFDKFKSNSGGKEMYFFTPREYYRKTNLRKRKAGSGHWKCTGDPRYITCEDRDGVIGEKRTLVFHNPLPTQFIITEYEQFNLPVKDEYVLCKLKIKNRSKKAKPDSNSSRPRKKARISKFLDANQDSKEMVANSADGKGEPSNRIASRQYLNNEIAICDIAEEFFPQNVDEMTANSSHKNADTSAPVEGEGYPCKISPDFDTQNRLEEKDVSFPNNYFSIVDPPQEETRLEDVNFQCHKEFDITHDFPTFGEINFQQKLEWLKEFLEVKDSNEAPELEGNFRTQTLSLCNTVRHNELRNERGKQKLNTSSF